MEPVPDGVMEELICRGPDMFVGPEDELHVQKEALEWRVGS